MSQFKSKEEYLNFISAWKSATNAKENKSERLVCDHVEYRWFRIKPEEKVKLEAEGWVVDTDYKLTKPNGGHYKTDTWLNAEHYLFYNMMKGRNLKHGFSPVTAMRKLGPGETVWRGFNSASWGLHFIVKDAKSHIASIGAGLTPVGGAYAKKFLEPFNGAVTMADLINIDLGALEHARKDHR